MAIFKPSAISLLLIASSSDAFESKYLFCDEKIEGLDCSRSAGSLSIVE